jgi:hypothetical protein
VGEGGDGTITCLSTLAREKLFETHLIRGGREIVAGSRSPCTGGRGTSIRNHVKVLEIFGIQLDEIADVCIAV